MANRGRMGVPLPMVSSTSTSVLPTEIAPSAHSDTCQRPRRLRALSATPSRPRRSPRCRQTPEDVARIYLSALLSGDLANAEAVSSPLLAQQLASAPPSVPSLEPIPPHIDFLALDRQRTTVDLAAELNWPDGRLAAMRVQLAAIDGTWKVTGVQP